MHLLIQAFTNHPTKQNRTSFSTYVYRALNICSDVDSLFNELNYLKSIVGNIILLTKLRLNFTSILLILHLYSLKDYF